MILAREHQPLVKCEALGREARLSIPTPDRFPPLLYVIASRRPGDAAGLPAEGRGWRIGIHAGGENRVTADRVVYTGP